MLRGGLGAVGPTFSGILRRHAPPPPPISARKLYEPLFGSASVPFRLPPNQSEATALAGGWSVVGSRFGAWPGEARGPPRPRTSPGCERSPAGSWRSRGTGWRICWPRPGGPESPGPSLRLCEAPVPGPRSFRRGARLELCLKAGVAGGGVETPEQHGWTFIQKYWFDLQQSRN